MTGLALANPLKTRLRQGKVCTSMIVRMARGPEIAGIARAAGLDACYIDLEHSPLSLDMAAGLCLWLRQADVTPLIRVAALDPVAIARALDAGALGVIVPHVETAAQTRAAVDAARFPPLGTRSWSSGQPLLGYGPVPAAQAQAALNEALLVALMIESRTALDQVGAIAATPGVDMLLIGAGDLLADMGHAGELHLPALAQAIERVIAAARPHGVAVGLGGLGQDRPGLRAWARRGVGFLSLGTDIAFLTAGAHAAVRAIGADEDSP